MAGKRLSPLVAPPADWVSEICLLGEFEPYRLLGFALHHSCASDNAATLGDVAHPKPDEIATSQLAVDGENEKRQIPGALG